MTRIIDRTVSFKLCLLATCLALFLTFGSVITAQSPKKIALLVGVSNYFNKNVEHLNYADNDVIVIGGLLRELGFDVTIITNRNARRQKVLDQFEEFIDRASRLEKKDIVFVMFSGHGQQLMSKQTKRVSVDGKIKLISEVAETPYFCPHDFIPIHAAGYEVRGKSDSQIAKDLNLISLNRVIASLDKKSNSTRNLLVIDACRNNPAKGKSINGNTITELRSGLSIFFGAVSGQKSWESSDPDIKHGVLSHFIIEGLNGKAANRLHEITWKGLLDYVSFEVENNKGELAGGPDRIQTTKDYTNISGTVVLGRKRSRVPLKFPFSKQDIAVARKSWADAEGVEESFVNQIGYSMQLIPPGGFNFGNPYSVEQIATLSSADVTDVRQAVESANRHPVQSLTIDRPFYIGKSEVTYAQFRAFIEETGHQPADGPWLTQGGASSKISGGSWKKTGYDLHDRGPVSNVSAADAEAFCRWLSKKTGRIYRLPTDAEWEYVAKGGQNTLWHFGNRPADLQQVVAKPAGLRVPTTQSGQPNPFGVYDLLGGVMEHCVDSRTTQGRRAFVTCGGQTIWWTPWVKGNEEQAFHFLPFARGRTGVNYTLGFRVVCEVTEPKKLKPAPVAGRFPDFEARFPVILQQTESPFREYMLARPNKLNTAMMADVAAMPDNRTMMIVITAADIENGKLLSAERICKIRSKAALVENKGALVQSLEKLNADQQLIEEVESYAEGKVIALPQVAKWKSADGKRVYICYGKVIRNKAQTPVPIKTFRDFLKGFGKLPDGWVEKKFAANEFTIAKTGLQLHGDFMLKFTVKSFDRDARFGFKLNGTESQSIDLTGGYDHQATWSYWTGGKKVRILYQRTYCTHYIIKRGREITIRVEQNTNPAREDPIIANLIVKQDATFNEIELSTFSRKMEISSISVHDLSNPVSAKPFTPIRDNISPYGKITPDWKVRTYVPRGEFTIEKEGLNLSGDFVLDFRVQTRKQGSFFAIKLLGTRGPNVTLGGLFHEPFSDGANWIYRTPEDLKLRKSVVHNENNYRLTRRGSSMTLEALNAIRSETNVISEFPVDKDNSFHGIQLSTFSKDIHFKSLSVKR